MHVSIICCSWNLIYLLVCFKLINCDLEQALNYIKLTLNKKCIWGTPPPKKKNNPPFNIFWNIPQMPNLYFAINGVKSNKIFQILIIISVITNYGSTLGWYLISFDLLSLKLRFKFLLYILITPRIFNEYTLTTINWHQLFWLVFICFSNHNH